MLRFQVYPQHLVFTMCFGRVSFRRGLKQLSLHSKMQMVFAAPFLTILLPAPMILLAKLGGRTEVFGTTLSSVYKTFVITALYLLHPAVLRECVLSLETLQVGDQEFVAADLSVPTDAADYKTTRALAIVLLCTFIPAVPAYLFGSLWSNRRHLQTQEKQATAPAWLREQYRYFYGSFKPKYFFWESVTFVHKSLLAVIAAKAEVVQEPGIPLFLATWVVLSQFIMEFRAKAYARPLEGTLQMVVLFALLGLMLAAQGLSVATLAGDEGFADATKYVAALAFLGVVGLFVSLFAQQWLAKRKDVKEEEWVRQQTKRAQTMRGSESESEPRDNDSESHTNPMYSHRVPKDQRKESHANPMYSHRSPCAESNHRHGNTEHVAADDAGSGANTETLHSKETPDYSKRTDLAADKLTELSSEQQKKEEEARVYL